LKHASGDKSWVDVNFDGNFMLNRWKR
jgi:hypothetical protein